MVEHGVPKCKCKHGTEGDTCNRCMSFFKDRPWQRGTKDHPNECKRKYDSLSITHTSTHMTHLTYSECNCNLHAKRCKFDAKKYDADKKS